MKKWLVNTSAIVVSAFIAVVMLVAQPAAALSGDGSNFVNCNGRFTVTNKYWGVARMSVYGCNNGYYYVYVTSSTNWAKGAGIKRDYPFNERYTSTTGYAYYSTVTPMLVAVNGTCYTATGWSMDSNSGATQSFRWCR